MIRRLVVAAVFLLLVAPRLAQAAPEPPYYLALGDSLARGVQPLPNGTPVETNQGFVDDLYGALRFAHPSLRLAKLGRSPETTTTMLCGGNGPCSYPYPAISQIAQAVAFIQAHHVVLITITIGGDNVLHCISTAGVDDQCVQDGLQAIFTDLPQIISVLQAAAGPGVRIVAANYYDPFLAASVLLPPPGGLLLAGESLVATEVLNSLLGSLYGNAGVPVADVATAFRLENHSLVPGINLPWNVFLELAWTWIGAPPPRQDIHPNAAGYLVIAGAFIKKIAAF
jgi:lysophospholipase L1-like esterase